MATSLVFGDTSGAVVFLHDSPPTLPARGMLDSADRKDFHILHRGHRDWVTQASRPPFVVLTTAMQIPGRGRMSQRTLIRVVIGIMIDKEHLETFVRKCRCQ